MSSVASRSGVGDVASRLAFFKGLQAVTNRVHATENIDEIIFELSAEICALFAADRLTIYVVDESKTTISSRVKTGLHTIRTIRLPIAENSVAGFVALTGQMLNIHDAYDERVTLGVRDVFPDVLKGLPVAEEVMDTPSERHMGDRKSVV